MELIRDRQKAAATKTCPICDRDWVEKTRTLKGDPSKLRASGCGTRRGDADGLGAADCGGKAAARHRTPLIIGRGRRRLGRRIRRRDWLGLVAEDLGSWLGWLAKGC